MATTTANGTLTPAITPSSICVIPPSIRNPTGGVRITALPARIDLQLYAGDDFGVQITVNDAAGGPYDLTGATITAHIRAAVIDPGTQADNGVLGAFGATVDGNTVTLDLANTVSAALPASAVWDVQLTRPDSTITTLLAGTVTMAGQVTV